MSALGRIPNEPDILGYCVAINLFNKAPFYHVGANSRCTEREAIHILIIYVS